MLRVLTEIAEWLAALLLLPIVLTLVVLEAVVGDMR